MLSTLLAYFVKAITDILSVTTVNIDTPLPSVLLEVRKKALFMCLGRQTLNFELCTMVYKKDHNAEF